MTAIARLPYRAEPGRFDEAIDERGAARPVWVPLAGALDRLGGGGLIERQRAADRLIAAEGASHLLHGDTLGDGGAAGRPWRVDPIPLVLDGDTWRMISRGVAERAAFIDGVLDDVYGAAGTGPRRHDPRSCAVRRSVVPRPGVGRASTPPGHAAGGLRRRSRAPGRRLVARGARPHRRAHRARRRAAAPRRHRPRAARRAPPVRGGPPDRPPDAPARRARRPGAERPRRRPGRDAERRAAPPWLLRAVVPRPHARLPRGRGRRPDRQGPPCVAAVVERTRTDRRRAARHRGPQHRPGGDLPARRRGRVDHDRRGGRAHGLPPQRGRRRQPDRCRPRRVARVAALPRRLRSAPARPSIAAARA